MLLNLTSALQTSVYSEAKSKRSYRFNGFNLTRAVRIDQVAHFEAVSLCGNVEISNTISHTLEFRRRRCKKNKVWLTISFINLSTVRYKDVVTFRCLFNFVRNVYYPTAVVSSDPDFILMPFCHLSCGDKKQKHSQIIHNFTLSVKSSIKNEHCFIT